MTEVNLICSEREKSFLPPACRVCPWHELPEESGDCLNFKKLLCRLEPAAILERFFNSGTH
ncbi:MAG: hypothetical protein HY790_05560 [Deltaproteobacteria bacterium]|nr:hypothetical protein [Deltaproteobacteria bacterium]MBI4795292.1 hypothetical protein [Deltaproteobacteria bacterium]